MKILLFSPHAFFDAQALPEALVGESLRFKDHDVVAVNCNGLYKNMCLCMPLVGMNDFQVKKEICKRCISNRDHVNKEFSLRSIFIDNYIDKKSRELIDLAAQSIAQSNYLEFQINEFPIAKYALYEFMLNHKLSSTNIPDQLWEEYVEIFKNTVATYYAILEILKQEKPDRITTYNSLYSVNRIVCAVADSMGIPNFFLHAGFNLKKRIQQLVIFRKIEGLALANVHPCLLEYRKRPCNDAQLDLINQHIEELFNASSPWVYSNKSAKLTCSEVRKRVNIKEGQRVILAVMRSNDERTAAALSGVDIFKAKPIFNSQLDWLKWLADFANRHPNYSIIFRVHPREFPNKREGVTSQNAENIVTFLASFDLPENVFINLPSDNLSLHDLLKISDLVLNNSSSAGLEAALFGISVLGIGDDLYSFDHELQLEPTCIDSYESSILSSALEKWSIERVIKAYRWLNYLNAEVAIDISDGYIPPKFVENRFLRFIYRVIIKVLSWAKLVSPFPEIIHRSKPLKNIDRLTYAILQDADSHVGQFDNQTWGGSNHEQVEIIKAYLSTMKSIASPNDIEFELRFKACVSGG